MANIHTLGFPRIGKKRELKFAVERYWKGECTQKALEQEAARLRSLHWQTQSGLDFITVGDFSYYDHVLDTSLLFGNLPKRSFLTDNLLDQYFLVARGRSVIHSTIEIRASEMTKWFDTNYHYIVPEFDSETTFQLNPNWLLHHVREARTIRPSVKPVLIGPLTYLWLGKSSDQIQKLQLLPQLVCEYARLLSILSKEGIEWVQLDEPILVTELDEKWKHAFVSTYDTLSACGMKLLVASYFGELQDNISVLMQLPVHGVHIDCVRGTADLDAVVARLTSSQIVSVGVIDGRNIWASPLRTIINRLTPIFNILGDRMWIAPSCSLLHVPVDIDQEITLPKHIRPWMSFATQKLSELETIKACLTQKKSHDLPALLENDAIMEARYHSSLTQNATIQSRSALYNDDSGNRSTPFTDRQVIQRQRLNLPKFPTTTIGSFPQTATIRNARKQFKDGTLSEQEYIHTMKAEIQFCIQKQEDLDLDVLVHGEPERNDMVEYFGEQLSGFVFSQFGWVQSYGSRCVKPPIIYGDVARPSPMTLEWIVSAQSFTSKPVKGMLTGPVTILNWSFVRDDQPRSKTCQQIALAIKDEVMDLEQAGISIIQIDEAALREGLPLRQSQWQGYLDWATKCFRLTATDVADSTQIHTHMCYSEFNDIIEAIASMDADVITIETSRSNMELLEAFKAFKYPNEIGPGVYDIHSPNIPKRDIMTDLLRKAMAHIPAEQLWINPDCGLKTRTWDQVIPALKEMVAAAKELRS